MLKKYKKTVAFFLSIIMVVSAISISAFATNVTGSGNESDITVITEDTFLNLFGDASATIEYSYSVSPANSMGTHTVRLDMVINTATDAYPVTVSGEVDETVLADDVTLLQGPLYGELIIGGETYELSAGFSKLLNDDAINVGIVINPTVQDPQQVMFAFGDVVITEEVQSLIDEYARAVQTEVQSEESTLITEGTAGTLGYSQGGSAYGYLGNTSTVGQTLIVYQDMSVKRIGVRVLTAKSNATTYYRNLYSPGASVRITKIVSGLERVTSGGASISNIDSVTGAYVGKGTVSLKPLIIDILSLLGIPTSTFEAALSGLTGSLTWSVMGSNASVTAQFGTTSNTSGLDSAGLSTIFNLINSGGAHIERFRAYSQVQYWVGYNVPLSGATSFYVTSNAEVPFGIGIS